MKLGIVGMPVHSVAEVPLRAVAAASALSLAPLGEVRPAAHAIVVTSLVPAARRAGLRNGDTVRTANGDSPDRRPSRHVIRLHRRSTRRGRGASSPGGLGA